MTATKVKHRRRTKTAAKVIQGPPPEADLSHIIEPLRPFAVHIAALAMDPRNPQLHDERNLAAMAKSMRRFGQDQPVIYRREDRVIIKGNGRYMAARTKLSWEWIAAIPVDDPLLEAAARGVADNQASRLADVDATIMGILLKTIRDDQAELLDSIGMTQREVESLIAVVDAKTAPGEDQHAKPPGGRPRVRKGDLWRLGEHRLVCGDSTDQATLKRLTKGLPVAMSFWDPPFGLDYRGGREVLQGDRPMDQEFLDQMLAPSLGAMIAVVRPNAAHYLWYAPSFHREIQQVMVAAGLVEHAIIVWAKPSGPAHGGGAHGDYQHAHEGCFYACLAGQRPKFYGGGGQHTVWRIGYARSKVAAAVIGTGLLVTDTDGNGIFVTPRPPKGRRPRKVYIEGKGTLRLQGNVDSSTVWEFSRDGGGGHGEHPTPKPVQLVRRAITNSTARGEIVLDPFIGSGTTIIAAETTGRVCHGVEIEPRFCALALRRWEELTGRKAERESSDG